MRISDWSSDVCSSDLIGITGQNEDFPCKLRCQRRVALVRPFNDVTMPIFHPRIGGIGHFAPAIVGQRAINGAVVRRDRDPFRPIHHSAARHASCGGGIKERSEEHTSELQSLMRSSYAVFCLTKKTQ